MTRQFFIFFFYFFFCQATELHTRSVVLVLSLLFLIHSHKLQIELSWLSRTGRWYHRIWLLGSAGREFRTPKHQNSHMARMKTLLSILPSTLSQSRREYEKGVDIYSVRKHPLCFRDWLSPIRSLSTCQPQWISLLQDYNHINSLNKKIASPWKPCFMVFYRSFVFF